MVWEVGWRLRLCLDGEDGGREVDVLLQLTERLAAGLVGRQAATDGARLCGAEKDGIVGESRSVPGRGERETQHGCAGRHARSGSMALCVSGAAHFCARQRWRTCLARRSNGLYFLPA